MAGRGSSAILEAESGLSTPNTELNLRVLGEVEKYIFIALPGKGGHSGLMPSKLSSPGGSSEKCYSNGSKRA